MFNRGERRASWILRDPDIPGYGPCRTRGSLVINGVFMVAVQSASVGLWHRETHAILYVGVDFSARLPSIVVSLVLMILRA